MWKMLWTAAMAYYSARGVKCWRPIQKVAGLANTEK